MGSDGFEFSCLNCCLMSISQIREDFPFPKNENKNRENPQMEKMYGKSWDILSLDFTLFLKSMDSDHMYILKGCFLWLWDWNASSHERKKGGVRHFMKCEMVAFHRPNWEPTFLSARTRDTLKKDKTKKLFKHFHVKSGIICDVFKWFVKLHQSITK